mmetsp:Transcript_52093/g.149351  ORF Transcript_52093/g.149351 Transcript_52093/m.149351 type:complete len:201 (-) Transcript_52093:2052-2654(-)
MVSGPAGGRRRWQAGVRLRPTGGHGCKGMPQQARLPRCAERGTRQSKNEQSGRQHLGPEQGRDFASGVAQHPGELVHCPPVLAGTYAGTDHGAEIPGRVQNTLQETGHQRKGQALGGGPSAGDPAPEHGQRRLDQRRPVQALRRDVRHGQRRHDPSGGILQPHPVRDRRRLLGVARGQGFGRHGGGPGASVRRLLAHGRI